MVNSIVGTWVFDKGDVTFDILTAEAAGSSLKLVYSASGQNPTAILGQLYVSGMRNLVYGKTGVITGGLWLDSNGMLYMMCANDSGTISGVITINVVDIKGYTWTFYDTCNDEDIVVHPILLEWLEANATKQASATPTAITYNGTETELETGQTATLACSGKKAVDDIVIVFSSAGVITYNGIETVVGKGQTATMLCAGKKMLTDVVVSTRTVLAAGLYETGTGTLLKSWDELISEGTITVTDGAVKCKDESIAGDLILPDDGSVTSIDDGAFRGCESLTSIVIPDSVTSIGVMVCYGCKDLTSITVDPNNAVFHSSGNCLIETTAKTLRYGCKTSKIPSDGSITTIDFFAFGGCTGLTSIEIPDSVTIIDYGAFCWCTSLTSIEIPDSVTSIGDTAFGECESLTDVYYGGTEAQWGEIDIDINGNEPLTNATIHYNYTGE